MTTRGQSSNEGGMTLTKFFRDHVLSKTMSGKSQDAVARRRPLLASVFSTKQQEAGRQMVSSVPGYQAETQARVCALGPCSPVLAGVAGLAVAWLQPQATSESKSMGPVDSSNICRAHTL